MSRLGRGITRTLLALVVVLALVAAFVWFASARALHRVHTVAAEAPLALPTDEASIERGRHLATAVSSCVLCHADDLGGVIAVEMGPVGTMVGANLTRGRGGVGGSRTTAELERAIRHGIRPDGTSLFLMPSEAFTYLSDSDLAAILAFLATVPPADRELPKSALRPLGRALLAFGQLDPLVAEKTARRIAAGTSDTTIPAHPPAIEPAPTAGYGAYLANIAGCTGCHGFDLAGRTVPGPPGARPPPDITRTALAAWSEADFVGAIRTGKRPDGRELDEFMPWRVFGRMTDDELHALWLYMASVAPKRMEPRS